MKQLLQAIETEPYKGIGKPEALKYSFTGLWSRRINLKDRLIYAIHNNKIVVYSLIGHYE